MVAACCYCQTVKTANKYKLASPGNEVLIKQKKEMLSLCEVQVMVSEQHAQFPYVNIALNSTATQSSDYQDRFSASRAVDGKRTGGLNKGSCSMTKSQAVNTWTLWLPGGRTGQLLSGSG